MLKSGKGVKQINEAKYLGCWINDKGDLKREINKRISECFLTWEKLDDFWRKSDCTVAWKLIVYDAVVRSKLMYGLDTVQINQTQIKQLRGVGPA